MKKLAIITTHPIQYNAPWFRLLAQRSKIIPKVFYTWSQVEHDEKFDPGFNKNIAWDIPLLDGYDYTFIKNISKNPGSHHFAGINNPTLINEVAQWNPDSILVFGWNFKSHLKLMKHFKGKKKILFRGDSNLLDDEKKNFIKKFLRRILLKKIYAYVDQALYVGVANKKYFLANGLKENQLVFAPHAIDNNRFIQKSNYNLRKQLNISESAFVFLFAGKFEQKKNVTFLFDSFVLANITNAHLILTGNGMLENVLKEKYKNVSDEMQQRIHFIDFQNQSAMPIVYASGDVLILPSQGPGETWGMAVNEAMAAGKAILVSNKCGCAEDLIQDGINGYVFESNNEEDLIKKMKQLSNNKERLQAMGFASLNIIQNWSLEKICDAVEQNI